MIIACTYVHPSTYICVYLVTYMSVHACAGLYMQILIVRTDGPVLSMCVLVQFQHMPVEDFALNMDIKLGID